MVILLVVILLTVTMFTNLKFIHPTRTKRWHEISLAICIAWIALAGWAAWWDFNEGPVAKWLLVLTSLYLVLAGIVQQMVPEGIRRVR
jgi:phosphatidylcholine synthase